ncbi:EamA family transporter RarD [Bhargavaea beijingensis]|uniref:Chloramphenicol-sensitive protein RarD n=1 Tax=Bhargavaea beijingensis TaxID=426756 RepID=A0A1G7EGF9_9BACL|nr:EamA family transporter RarD [Bhargavaea beijingensis]RSK25367.1 EamA family transporter RarD [Bhargavaea beijingensis]SDE62732.1 chloramphenicol-sensitive protein RarD [Bhargavaea beijingensis]
MESKEKAGIIWAASAYLIWGVLPIYWKSLGHVPSGEVLAQRIFWASITTGVAVLLLGQGKLLAADLKALWKNKRAFWSLLGASIIISGNWFLFIWAVNNGHIVQTSLGYYINPLLSILLGIVFLKERLSSPEKAAVVLALMGVLIITVSHGTVPWLALGLAGTFAVYGFAKKTIHLDALRGLTIETAFIAPAAAVYLIWAETADRLVFFDAGPGTVLLLILSGAATAIPLVLFARGAQSIPLYLLGFLQYVAPTMMLFLGVVVYGEAFGTVEMIAFSFIWAGLVLVTLSKFRMMKKMRFAQEK